MTQLVLLHRKSCDMLVSSDIIFRAMQRLCQLFTASSFGRVSAESVANVLEVSFPGITSYIRSNSGSNDCLMANSYFPADKFFESLSEAHSLHFERVFDLLRLDIEVQRQKSERLRLHEEAYASHPNTILGQSKDSWFTELITERLSADRYHVTYVSTQNWIEVIYPSVLFL